MKTFLLIEIEIATSQIKGMAYPCLLCISCSHRLVSASTDFELSSGGSHECLIQSHAVIYAIKVCRSSNANSSPIPKQRRATI